jgi:hypothetical protein
MRFNELTSEGIEPSAKAAIKGMRQLSGDQYYGLYKTMKDVAGHDGKKQTAPNGNSDHEVSDQPFAYAYTDEEKKMIKGVDPKAKQITSDKSEELDESQLDEIDRRGFLRGMGAAAVAGAAGSANADWTGPFTQTDQMTDKVTRRWHNESTDRSTDLIIKDTEDNLGAILVGSGPWDWPRDRSAPEGRVRIDSQPAFNVMFAKPANRNDLAWISTYFDERGNKAGPHPAQIKQMIASAKSRILVDVSSMSNKGILQFNVQQKAKESVEQGVAEGRYDNRDAYQRDYDSSQTGFTRGADHRDDERHDLDIARPMIYGLKINGNIYKKDGNTVTFFTKERAMAAKNSMLNKRPELEITLIQRPQD